MGIARHVPKCYFCCKSVTRQWLQHFSLHKAWPSGRSLVPVLTACGHIRQTSAICHRRRWSLDTPVGDIAHSLLHQVGATIKSNYLVWEGRS